MVPFTRVKAKGSSSKLYMIALHIKLLVMSIYLIKTCRVLSCFVKKKRRAWRSAPAYHIATMFLSWPIVLVV